MTESMVAVPNPFRFPGFRFSPTDTEMVGFLKTRVAGLPLPEFHEISEVELYGNLSPQEIFSQHYDAKTELETKTEKYFFTPLKRTVKGGQRFVRTTGGGTWKQEKSDDILPDPVTGQHTAIRKLLTYKPRKSDPRVGGSESELCAWVMHEYTLATAVPTISSGFPPSHSQGHNQEIAICRIRKRESEKGNLLTDQHTAIKNHLTYKPSKPDCGVGGSESEHCALVMHEYTHSPAVLTSSSGFSPSHSQGNDQEFAICPIGERELEKGPKRPFTLDRGENEEENAISRPAKIRFTGTAWANQDSHDGVSSMLPVGEGGEGGMTMLKMPSPSPPSPLLPSTYVENEIFTPEELLALPDGYPTCPIGEGEEEEGGMGMQNTTLPIPPLDKNDMIKVQELMKEMRNDCILDPGC